MEEHNEEQEQMEETPKQDMEPVSVLDKAKTAHEQLKAENDRFEELLNRQERMIAENMLHGRASAGNTQEKKEESDSDYVKRIMKGEE